MTKRARTLSRIESLEARIAPATLNFAADGTVTYTAGAGISNFLTLSITGSNYRFDDVENIAVTGFGSATGSGTSVVDLNVSGITSLVFNLGDQNDTLLIRNLQHPLTVNDGAGNDTVRFETNAKTVNGNVTVAAETINVEAALTVNAGTVTFSADTMAINARLTSDTRGTIQTLTAGRGINLGTENAAQLSFTNAEIDNLRTNDLTIGSTSAGAIELSAPIVVSTGSFHLKTSASVSTTGTGSLNAFALGVEAGGAVSLTGANSFLFFAMSSGSSGVSTIRDDTGFNIGTVDGVFGIANNVGTTVLNTGSIIQGSPVVSDSLALTGNGPFDLSLASNSIGALAANTPGAVTFKNSGPLFVQTVGGTTGVTAQSVRFTAPDLAINAAINVGTGDAFFTPSNSTSTVDLAGSGGANTFALSIAELGSITAGKVFIGSSANAMNIGNVFSLSGSLRLTASSISGPGGIVVPTLTISSPNIQLGGSNNVSTLILDGSVPITAFSFKGGDNFTIGAVNVDTPLSFLAGANLSLPNGIITLGPDAQFVLGIGAGGAAPIEVSGEVTLNTQLRFNQTSALPFATTFTVLFNDGSDAINGTFNGLPEGALVPGITPPARISYIGGNGNDVTIRTAEALDVDIATDGKSATFRDADGDLVTVKATKGTFTPASFSGYQTGVIGGGQLTELTLDATFTGANIAITAAPTPLLGGNGFVNIGFIDATGVDLGAVTLPGDLGRINAGTVGGSTKVPGLKSLTVESFGLLGTSTQSVGGVNLGEIQGTLGALTVKGDLCAELAISGTDGTLVKATIGGSIKGRELTHALEIITDAGIGSLNVGGDIGSLASSGVSIVTYEAIGSITVGGSIVGTALESVNIAAFGQRTAVTKGVDMAIKTISVKGSVEGASIFAGTGMGPANADASIGSITVGGDWIASTVVAGDYLSAGDNVLFTNDDTLDNNADRNVAGIAASIASFTVKGQAFGTADNTADMFGIVAEQIGKAKVGTRTFAFKADKGATLNREAFFAAPTITGAGAENPAFDFTIRELGSTTPTITALGANLTLSTDFKTATFTDVDGDLVTVKRTAGAFAPGDFTITAAGIGGLLRSLDVTPDVSGKAFDLTITAKVGPNGGNGFVNVGEIDARQTDLGKVTIGGELQDLSVGDNNDSRIALGSLAVQSLGTLGGTAPFGDEINGKHGLGKITVKTDIRSTDIFSNNPTGNLTSLTVGGSVTKSTIQSAAGIGTITIGGSFRDFGRIQAFNRVSAITIGGDLYDTEVELFAISTLTKGPDNAIGKLTIGGNLEKTDITIGRNNNADSGIGALSVGRAWIASSILASTTKGLDGFAGTGDDQKVSIGIDEPTRFSTIASILIKGQALGTPDGGDHFGIVAEQIGKAQIGAIKYAFKPITSDFFAAAPTGPGKGAFPFETFDFYIRELF